MEDVGFTPGDKMTGYKDFPWLPWLPCCHAIMLRVLPNTFQKDQEDIECTRIYLVALKLQKNMMLTRAMKKDSWAVVAI